MKRPTLALWVAALTSGWAAAQDTPPQDPPKQQPPGKSQSAQDPATQAFNALRQEKQKLSADLRKKVDAEKDSASKRKLVTEYFTAVRKLDLAFATKYPKHGAALNMLVQAGTPEAAQLVLEHYGTDKRLGLALFQAGIQMGNLASADADPLFRILQEKAPTKESKGLATLALAVSLKGQAENTEDTAKAPALQAEAEKLFAEIEKTYPDVSVGSSTAGEFAKKNLFELRFLSVGKVAPDIEGHDVDGKAMKLSDYKGKVILLDFWAHW